MAARRRYPSLTRLLSIGAVASLPFLASCDDPVPQPSKNPETVQLGSKTLKLRLVADELERQQVVAGQMSLTEQDKTPIDGLLIALPAPEQVKIDGHTLPAPIDAVVLDSTGHVIKSQAVTTTADVTVLDTTAATPGQFEIILPSGTLATLGVKDKDPVKLDTDRLIKMAKGPLETVKIGGRTFHLELAATDGKRFRGLSDRTSIEPDGGMLFVFPASQRLEFVMRDCPIPIDIIFLDGSGRVTAMHKMQIEPPNPGESDTDYNARLKRYSSRYAAQYAIELAANTFDTLGLKENDQIKLDESRLKKLAK
jgi:uncharacterized membrane protein (UPF0127 family)